MSLSNWHALSKSIANEKKIYSIINNEISNNDNKAVAFLEMAKTNLILGNLEKVKIDLKKSSENAEKSSTCCSPLSLPQFMVSI